MALHSSQPQRAEHFKGSLARSVTLTLLIISLLPLILLGVVNLLRSRQLIDNQTEVQMETISRAQANQLEDLAEIGQNALEKAASDEILLSEIQRIAEDPNNLDLKEEIVPILSKYRGLHSLNSQVGLDHISVFEPDGVMLLSTNNEWMRHVYLDHKLVQQLRDFNTTLARYNPKPFYVNQLVFFASKRIENDYGQLMFLLVGSIVSPLPRSGLVSASGIFPSAQAYLLTNDQRILAVNPSEQELIPLQNKPAYLDQAQEFAQKGSYFGSYTSYGGLPVLGYVHWIPELELGLIVEVPLTTVYQQLGELGPLNVIIIAVAAVISSLLIYFASRRIVTPITTLVHSARLFIEGNWDQRAKVNRRDELGLLAFSINNMIQQIGDLYRSMESKVDLRTRQIHTANEVIHESTSHATKAEILERSTRSIVNRFGFLYAGMYLLDDTNLAAVCQVEAFKSDQTQKFKGDRVRTGSTSLLGWVLANNQTKTTLTQSPETIGEETFNDLFIENAVSSVAVPLSIDKTVLGVLHIQSDEIDRFDTDTLAVLQMLASQLARSLESATRVEAARISKDETAVLHEGSRKISRANEEDEIFQSLVNALQQTSLVSGIYTVEEDHLRVLAMVDPRNPTPQSTAQGITVPFAEIQASLKGENEIVIEDLSKPGDFDNLMVFFSRRGCRSAAIFPIHNDNQITELVVVGSREGTLTSETLQPYANLVTVTGAALGRLHVLARLALSLTELQSLAKLSQTISIESEMPVLYQRVHEEIANNIGQDLEFAITLYDAENQMISIPYAWEGGMVRAVDSFPLGEGLTSYLINNRRSLFINHDTIRRAEQLGARMIGSPAKSWLGVPMIVAGKVLGTIIIQDTQNEGRFKEEDLKLIETIAPQISVSIRNAQLMNEMKEALRAYDQERFLLDTLLKNIPDKVYFKDNDSRYLRVSSSFAKGIGVDSPDLLTGKSDFELFGQEVGQSKVEEERQLLASGAVEIGQIYREETMDGQETWTLVSRIPIVSPVDEGIIGLLGISHDITEMRQAQASAQKNAQQLRTAAEIARDTSGTLNLEDLLTRAVNLVRERFGFYHSSIFLLDPVGEYAILRESTGEAGAKMKAAGHRLAVGSRSIVGQVTARREPLVINDVLNDPNYYANPLLPDTRAEAAIPLMVGDRVLGALDVQSHQKDSFTPDDIATMQILADQLAVAVLNAELFTQAQENLAMHRLMHDITTTAAARGSTEEVLLSATQKLRSAMQGMRIAIYLVNEQDELDIRASAGYEGVDLTAMKVQINDSSVVNSPVGLAAVEQQAVLVKDGLIDSRFPGNSSEMRSQLHVPVTYSGRLMGIISIESPDAAVFDENDQEIVGTLGSSLGAILSNAQLIGQVRRQVERQRLIYETTSRIRRSVDIQTILRTSTSEICRALGAVRAQIEISVADVGLSTPGAETAASRSQEMAE